MQGSRANKEARRGNACDGMIPRKKYALGGSLVYGNNPQQNNQMNTAVMPNRMNSFRAPDDGDMRPNRYYAEGGNVKEKWMQDVHPKKGALHKALKIPKDKKIPTDLLEKEKKSKSPLMRKRATLALNYRGD